MLPLLLAALLQLPGQLPNAPTRPAQPPATAQDPLQAEFDALGREFSATRQAYDRRIDELRKQGGLRPEDQPANPALAFWPRFEALAQRGSVGARLWLAMLYPSAHPALAGAERDKPWREYVLAAVAAGANTPLERDISHAMTMLYLDAPPAIVDEAVEDFVKRTQQRELAADALYRASVAKPRGAPGLASPRAAEFGKRLAAEYAETAAARQARGETGVGLAIGKQAPDFTAKDADGVAFKLSDYRGKVVVLDFWGYW